MVVIALDVSFSRLSIDLNNRSPYAYTAPSSSSKGQLQQQRLRLCCSSSSLRTSSTSATSFFYPYLSSSSSCCCSSSSATSSSKRSLNRCASDSIRSRRTTTDTGAVRKTSSRSIVSVRHGGPGAGPDANQSRLAVGARPAALVNGSSNAGSVHAAIAETAGEGLKWWERGGAPNISDVHTTEEFVGALSAAGDKLVIVEFYATWCGSCRALYPKFCKIAAEYSDVNFLKVNFDENKSMCKSLNVKVLPFFHIYRGAEGRLDSFSCSLSKLQRLKDAIAKHHDGLCEDCPPPELLGDVFTSLLGKTSADQSATAGGSSD